MAKITGSLSDNLRVQRLRLRAGWNLVGIAVDGAKIPPGAGVTRAYRWHQPASAYLAIGGQESLTAGTVLWIKAEIGAVLSLIGRYNAPAAVTIPAGQSFVAGPVLQAWPLQPAPELAFWQYDGAETGWHTGFSGGLEGVDRLPRRIVVDERYYQVLELP